MNMWTQAIRPQPEQLSDQSVTRAAILAAAFGMLDEKGFERLSLRRLIERLNADPASLRRHFARRRVLIEAMAAAMAREAASEPAAGIDWRMALRIRAIATRRAMLARRDGAIVMARGLPGLPSRDRGCAALLAASGFNRDDAAGALETVDRFTVGCALSEQAAGDTTHEADRRFLAQLDAVLRGLAPGAPVEESPAAVAPGRPHILQIRLANMLRDTRESADIAYARTTRLIDVDRRIVLLLAMQGMLAPVRVSALLGIDKAQVSRAVRRLEDKALVARASVRGPLDLTPDGRILAQRLRGLADVRDREIASTLASGQMAAFLTTVQALTARATLLLEQERKLVTPALTHASPDDDDHVDMACVAVAGPSRIVPALALLSAFINRSAALAFRRLAGLSNFEACVLIAIGEAAPMRWPTLAETIGRDQSQAGRTVRLLTGIGLVARSGGPERRDGAFTLTGKGKRVHALLDELGKQRHAFLTRDLGEGQLGDFSATFDIVIGNAAAQLGRERAARQGRRT